MLSDILQSRKCFKLVCGVGNEDVDEVEKLVYTYSKAGCNLFDVSASPNVIKSAKSALKKAGITDDRYLCVSVGIKGDPHTLKASIDYESCINCGRCQHSCPQNAIVNNVSRYIIENKKCIGCARCKNICPKSAINFASVTMNFEQILPAIIKEGIDCLEFHAISDDDIGVLNTWNILSKLYKGFMSICVDRSKIGNEKLIKRLSKMLQKRNPYTTIIQADGAPMSGGRDNYKSTLQAIATAEIIQNSKLPAYVLLSGGTNSKSAELAKLCEVDICGVAIGSYARHIVKEYINKKDFWENNFVQKEAINRASDLVNSILKFLG